MEKRVNKSSKCKTKINPFISKQKEKRKYLYNEHFRSLAENQIILKAYVIDIIFKSKCSILSSDFIKFTGKSKNVQ